MIKKYKITYKTVIKHKTIVVEAFSKADAKQRFFMMYPWTNIINVEEVEQ